MTSALQHDHCPLLDPGVHALVLHTLPMLLPTSSSHGSPVTITDGHYVVLAWDENQAWKQPHFAHPIRLVQLID